MWHQVIRLGLVRIFYPCLMIFGTIGNILCLKILLRKRFRRQSTCQYLCVLAVIDILFIYMRSSRFLYRHVYKVDLRNTSLWICRTYIFFSSALSHMASWILVIVSFDRYLIIRNLFPRRQVGWRVLKCTCVLIVIVCLANLHYFHILGTHMRLRMPGVQPTSELYNESFYYASRFVCIARHPFKEFFRWYAPIFDLLFVAIIPFCLMIFTNIGIIRTTMCSNMLCTSSRKQQRNNRLTVMLLSVILAFMLLTCPSVIYICLNRLRSSTTFSDTNLLILDLLESLWYTKHALNFILYTLSGQDFRREFIKLLPCCSRKVVNTLSHEQDSHTTNRNLNASVISHRSTSTKKQSSDCKKQKQIEELDRTNNFSPLIISKSLRVRMLDEKINESLEREFVLLSASSSVPTGNSMSSDHRRSSSITRTSVH